MTQDYPPVADTALAGGLISSPAWGPLLTQTNALLTTLTLVIGLLLGCCRLAQLIRERKK